MKYTLLHSSFVRLAVLIATTIAACFPSARAQTSPVLPSIYAFNVSGVSTINQGQSVSLNWSVGDATTLTLSPGVGNVTGTTSVTVSPLVTTTYKLTATNAAGTVTKTRKITVSQPAAIPTLTATPATVLAGEPVTLEWQVTGTESLWLSADRGGDPGSMNYQRSTVVYPTANTRYTLSAWSPVNGSVSRAVSVTVLTPPPPPPPAEPPAAIALFVASPTQSYPGQPVTLT